MQNLNEWRLREGNRTVTSNRRPYPGGALTAANQRAQAEIAHTGMQAGDARGEHLRLLRTRQNKDPVLLATQACISLRQLYQLESGETSLFYSPGLRNQAGRRVALLLGVQWDDLGQAAPAMPVASADKVLKLVTAEPAPVATTASVVAQDSRADVQKQAPFAPVNPTQPGAQPDMAISAGLHKPASETVLEEVSVTARLSHRGTPEASPAEPSGKRHPARAVAGWLTGWLMAAVAGAGTGWSLVVYAGVRWKDIAL